MKRLFTTFLFLSFLFECSAGVLGSWTYKSSIAEGRRNLSAVVVNGKIYAIGGGLASNPWNHRRTEEYDPSTDTWTIKQQLQNTRYDFALSVVDGKIYAIGGHNGSNPITSVELYDPSTNTWTSKTSMPTARGGVAGGVVNNKIYVIGGENQSGTSLATVEEYNPVADTVGGSPWTTKTSLPQPTGVHAVAVYNNKVYVFGGKGVPGTVIYNDVQIYDPSTDSWSSGLPMPTARQRLGATVLGNKIYVVGGTNNSNYTNVTEIYDPLTNSWSVGDSLQTTRNSFGITTLNNNIFVIGGGSQSTPFLSSVECYTPDLVAYYPFNNNANDESGNGFNGQLFNNPLLSNNRFNNSNSAFSFNGTNQYIEIQDPNGVLNFDVNTQFYSVCAWVKLSSLAHDQTFIVDRGDGDEPESYTLQYRASEQKFFADMWNVPGNCPLWSTTSPSIDIWYHLSMVVDNQILKFYVNGVLQDQKNLCPSILVTENNLHKITIGRMVPQYSDYTEGVLDDIRIYNRALSASEISNLYHEDCYGYTSNFIIPSIVDTVNDTVFVPVNISIPSCKSYSSAEFKLGDYQAGLEFIGIETASSFVGDSGWSVQVFETDTSLNIATAGAKNISGDGTLLWVKFKLTGSICTSYPITFKQAFFNTGNDSATKANGSVTIKARPVYGDVDLDGNVYAVDASAILKHLVYDSVLTCQQIANADVTLHDSITALDASVILMYRVGRITSLPYDTTAFGTLRASGTITMSNIKTEGNRIEIPLNLSGGSNILSFEGNITYNPDDLSFMYVLWSEQLNGFEIPIKVESGRITFAGANSLPDGQVGVFATLVFTKNPSFTETVVSIDNLQWNEEETVPNAASITIRDANVFINVAKDWNMVSVPIGSSDFRKTTIYPTAISNAFAYQRGYETRDTLKNGEGYWVKFAEPQGVTYSGTENQTGRFDVNAGWNMIGSISSSVSVSTISSEPAGIVTSQFFGYNAGYFSSATIEPGKACWVKVNQSGTLILSSSATMSAVNKITIVPTNELPPSPPDGEVNSKNSTVPSEFALAQNYPNPFNPVTVISYQLKVKSDVTLKIYDVLGQEVATLVHQTQDAGYKSIEWDASNIESGIYFYRLTAGNFVETKKLLLVK
ncbi:MAG: T9SS type A sorting domain-containing protein [Ignavibacteriae bacterium]|nr:T9SS type A sorting domain-containing protein [Ignavibacteriota bacterium]